jgi:hypothetical protein
METLTRADPKETWSRWLPLGRQHGCLMFRYQRIDDFTE